MSDEMRTSAPRRYLTGLESAVTGNAQAFGFSILITVTFGSVAAAHGNPSRGELIAFALAAVASFSLFNVVVAVLNRRYPEDTVSTHALLVATATDFVAVGAGVATALGVTALISGGLVWALAPAAAALVYVLIQALEFAIGRAASDEDE